MDNKKNKLKIGIDIDEVVAEYIQSLLNYLKKTRGKEVSYEDIVDYNLREPFGMTQQEIWKLVEEHTSDEKAVIDLDLVPHSKESINKLKENNEIFFITSRHPSKERATLDFFEKHFPENNFNLLFSGESWNNGNKTKREICENNKINFLIEDNPYWSLDCAKSGIKTFLLDKPWNQRCPTHENLIRVKNWKEILEEIEKIKNGY